MDTTNQTVTQPVVDPIPLSVRSFLEGVLSDSGMPAADPVMKEDMVRELFVRLDHYITAVIVDNLPPEHLDAFMKLTENEKSMEKIEAFIAGKVPNVQDLFVKAFADFRQMFFSGMTQSRNLKENQQLMAIADATPRKVN